MSFRGQFYDYSGVPIELEPFQKPHPPFWAGAGTPDGAAAAGQNGFNLVANALTAQIRTMTEHYRAACKMPHENGAPMLGLARFVIMGETDEQALTIARRAYPLWHRHFHHLFRMHGTTPAGGDRPPQFDQIKDGGRGIAGAPDTVIRMIKSQMEEAGTNYFVAQFAFGDLTPGEVMRTVDLFTREVMPALQCNLNSALLCLSCTSLPARCLTLSAYPQEASFSHCSNHAMTFMLCKSVTCLTRPLAAASPFIAFGFGRWRRSTASTLRL